MYIMICLRNSRVIIGDGEQSDDEEWGCMAQWQKTLEIAADRGVLSSGLTSNIIV